MNTDHHITEVLRQAGSRLDTAGVCFGHGTDNAVDEAFWLICHALDLPVHEPLPDIVLDTTQQQRVFDLIEQRINSRKPAAYLTGSTWFAGLSFNVTTDVLVPRSPLAELIENQFQPWLDADRVNSLLDIGTGSGCIAIACAYYMPECQVTGSDVSPQALQLASENACRHQLAGRCKWVESDLFAGLQGQSFDLIISNPPYVPDARRQTLANEYLAEPDLGLYSGTDGLDHAAGILLQASSHLLPDGLLILEIGESAERLQTQLPMIAFIWPEFEHGGDGVLIADRQLLQSHQHDITQWYQHRMTNGQ